MRTQIHQLIKSINPYDQLEREHIDFSLRWIESGREIFRIEKPATPDIHLVSYFLVMEPKTNEVLLVDHNRAKLWLPTGGHVEPNEHPKETVKREVREELNIEAEFLFEEPVFLSVAKTVGNHPVHTDVSIWYLLKGDPSCNYIYDRNEFNQIRWFEIDKIPFDHSDQHMKRFIQKINCPHMFAGTVV